LYQSDVGRSLAFAASPDLSAREAVKKAMEDAMPKYLFEAQYSADGAKGVVKEGGTPRRAAVARMAESVGGKLESFYFAFGGVDAYATIDLPDNASAAAVALAVSQAGAATTRTVVLVTPEEIDAASRKAVDYRPPGR
jgi:uncharacterized protein with GYD domain